MDQDAGRDGRVVSVQLCEIPHQPPVRQPVIRAVPEAGIHGDLHAGPRRTRQVLLVDTGILEELSLQPGDLREQITVDLPGLMELPAETLLALGEAILQVAGPCNPCTHIGEDLGVPDPELLQRRLEGRRGMLASVVSVTGEGRIRPGDEIVVRRPSAVGGEDTLP